MQFPPHLPTLHTLPVFHATGQTCRLSSNIIFWLLEMLKYVFWYFNQVVYLTLDFSGVKNKVRLFQKSFLFSKNLQIFIVFCWEKMYYFRRMFILQYNDFSIQLFMMKSRAY